MTKEDKVFFPQVGGRITGSIEASEIPMTQFSPPSGYMKIIAFHNLHTIIPNIEESDSPQKCPRNPVCKALSQSLETIIGISSFNKT